MNRDEAQEGGMSRAEGGRALHPAEFVALVGLLMSLVALAIDAMLPALPAIGRDLGVARTNDVQLVIMSLFLGMGVGQLLFGPLSDRIGRKPAIHAGLVLFMIGCLVSIFAPTFEIMIAGRVLQGIGVAGPRICSIALVRDQYEGRMMARLMSFAMAVFILVPTVAPALGQGLLFLGGWHAIFITFLVIAAENRPRLVRDTPAGDPARRPSQALLAPRHRRGRGRDREDQARDRVHARHGLRLRALRGLSRLGPADLPGCLRLTPARSSRSISGCWRSPSAPAPW